MENSLVRALSHQEFKKVNKEILGHVTDVLGNSADIIASAASTFFTGNPMLINFYSLLIKPFIEGYATFRDFVELEKVATFFDRVNELPFETRQEFSEKLKEDNDHNFTKNLIYSVSLLRDLNEAKITANLFIALVEGNINKEEFQSILNIIKIIDFSDLRFFKDKLDIVLNDKIDLSNKKKSLEKIDFLFNFPQFMGDFKARRNIFVSNGLINENILIQKVPKIFGNSKESEEVARLRDSLSTINISYSISNRGALLYIYGLKREREN